MAVTITLKTLQQQTFKIRMEPDETVRAGARGRERPGAGVVGGREAGIQREGRRGRRGWALPSPSGPTSSDPPRSALPCPGGLGAVPGPVPGSSQVWLPCQLRAPLPSLQAAQVPSVPKRCRLGMTMMMIMMIINGLNRNSFGGPCLLAVYSLPVIEYFLVSSC